MQSCNVEPALVAHFESLAASGSQPIVGTLIGRPQLGSRTAVFACVPSIDEEGKQAITVESGALQLWFDKLETDLDSLLRSSMGGLTVVGMYAFAPKALLPTVQQQLRTLISTLGPSSLPMKLKPAENPVMLLVNSESGALQSFICSNKTASTPKLKPCEMQHAPLLKTFQLVSAPVRIHADVDMLATDIQSLKDHVLDGMVKAMAGAEAAQFIPPTPAAVAVIAPNSAVKDILTPSDAQETRLRTRMPLPCCTAAASRPTQQKSLKSQLHMEGSVVACAFVQRHEDWGILTSLLRADVTSTLAIRVMIAADKAMDTLYEADDQVKQEQIEGGFLVPELAEEESVSGTPPATDLRLSSRLIMTCQPCGLPLTEYQSPWDGVDLLACHDRIATLFGLMVAPESVKPMEMPAQPILLSGSIPHAVGNQTRNLPVGLSHAQGPAGGHSNPQMALGFGIGVLVLVLAVAYMWLT